MIIVLFSPFFVNAILQVMACYFLKGLYLLPPPVNSAFL